MKYLITLLVILSQFITYSMADEKQILTENKEIAAKLYKIKYYDAGCTAPPEYDAVSDYGIEAIPTLLANIRHNLNEKYLEDLLDYVYISSCLVHRISDNISPLDWEKIYDIPFPCCGFATAHERDALYKKIAKELREKKILDCHIGNNDEIFCDRI